MLLRELFDPCCGHQIQNEHIFDINEYIISQVVGFDLKSLSNRSSLLDM